MYPDGGGWGTPRLRPGVARAPERAELAARELPLEPCRRVAELLRARRDWRDTGEHLFMARFELRRARLEGQNLPDLAGSDRVHTCPP